jgi:phosphinothricin acetyltransferase
VPIVVRPAEPRDAEAVAEIYNHGIAERQATFETRPRDADEILGWLDEGRPFIVAEDTEAGRILGFARVSAYSTRRAYAGVGEHAVYVDPDARGRDGAGCELVGVRTVGEAIDALLG